MAKKKDNSKRNLALGVGGLVASGLAIKNGKALGSLARKAYDATKRLGKKRGKYKTTVANLSDDIEVPIKENVTQYINRTKGKSKLTKTERSALTKERQKKLDYTTLSPEKRVGVFYKLPSEERRKLLDSLTPEEKLKFKQEMNITDINNLKDYIKNGPDNPYQSKAGFQINKRASARERKEKIDELRILGQYSRKLYLISDFTFR